MVNNKLSQYIVVLIHTLIWILLAFVFLFYPPLNFGIELPRPFWIVQTAHLVLLVALFYVNGLKMVPHYLVKGRLASFAIWTALAVGFLILVNKLLENHYELPRLFDEALGIKKKHELINVYALVTTLLVMGISTSTALIQHFQKEKQSRQIFEQQQTSSELSLLIQDAPSAAGADAVPAADADYVFLKAEYQLVKIAFDDILYIEAVKD